MISDSKLEQFCVIGHQKIRAKQSPGKCFCATRHKRIQYKESAGLTTDSVAVVVQCSKKRAGSSVFPVLDRDRLQNVKR